MVYLNSGNLMLRCQTNTAGTLWKNKTARDPPISHFTLGDMFVEESYQYSTILWQ